MPKLFSRFNVIALSLYSLPSAGLATYLSNRYVLQTLSQALPPASSIVKAGIKEPTDGAQSVVFAGGCFWGVQSVFQHTQGVISAVSGYAGGLEKDAQYTFVTTGSTGHAEAVQVVYDPKQISYEQLLRVYLTVAHDPTQRNAQYPDEGPQYRSAVFYANDYQRQLTERYIAQVDSLEVFTRPIVTQLTPLASTGFYPAEEAHQNFAAKNPNNAYIAQFDKPKLVTFKSLLPELFREKPVLL